MVQILEMVRVKGVKDSLCRTCATRGGDICNKYPNHKCGVKVVFRSLSKEKIMYADKQECPNYIEREGDLDDSCGFLDEDGKMKNKPKSIMDYVE